MMSLALGGAMVTLVICAAPASAHAVLVKITPDADADLAAAPTEVVLEFDEPVSSAFATVVVNNAAGVSVARGKPMVLGGKVRQPLSPSMASGVYRVAYRVVSNDGHPVSGQSAFTLTIASGAGPATPGATSPASGSATPATSGVATGARPSTTSLHPGYRGSTNRSFLQVSGALALFATGAGVFLWHRRGR